VTGSNDTTVRLWKTDGRDASAVLRESGAEIGALALSPDETLLATGSADGIIRLYHLPNGTPAGEFTGMPGKIMALAFTPDNCILTTGHDRGICTVLVLPDKKIVHTIPAHAGAITGLAILPDDQALVTTGDDGVSRIHPLPANPILAHADFSQFEDVVREEKATQNSPVHSQWTFLRTMLSLRFMSEIGICLLHDAAGRYDIEIVG